ncbi:MAG TPA: extracellular solute-binding protein [Chloroflexota bacterium]|nr:extracellular solute-binding protein [Chloroflexota bacterium]
MTGISERRTSRRQLLAQGATLTLGALSLAACGTSATTTAATSAASASTSVAATTSNSASASVGTASATTSAAATAASATATASPASAPSAAASAQKLAGTAVIWTRETGANGAREPLINQHLADFEKATGVKATAQYMVFQESIQKEQAAIAAGSPPEVAQQGPDVTLSFAAAGNLQPLDSVLKELGPQNFISLQKDAYVNWHGQQFGIPWYMETRIIFYHKDLLDKAGVKPPTLWSEWGDAAQKLTTAQQYGFANPFDGPGPGQFWVSLAQSNGGLLLDQNGAIASNSPSVKEGLQFASDFFLKYKTMPKAALTYKATDEEQLFLLKKVAMLYGNGQIIDDVVTQKKDMLPNIGAFLMPVNKAGQTSRSFLGGWNLFAFKAAKNPDAGLALLKWMYQEPWYTNYMQVANGANLPVTKAAAGSDFFQKDELRKLLITAEQTAVRYGGPVYGNAPYLGAAEGNLDFSNALTNVDAGKATVDAAIATLTNQLTTLAKTAPK